jgi:hypothetical protein
MSRRDSLDAWAGTIARYIGIGLEVLAAVEWKLSGHPAGVVFGTGAVLISGGAGIEAISILRKAPEPPPAKEEPQ